MVGKWHLGLGWQMLPNGEKRQAKTGPTKGDGWQIDYGKKVDGGPLAIGFDESFIIPASLDMYPYVYLKNDKPTEWATVTKAFHRPGPSGEKFEAIDCLRDFRPRSKPVHRRPRQGQWAPQTVFPLPAARTSPHTPIIPAKPWQGKSGLGSYGDFLMETDWVVGEVLKTLDRNKLVENTMVIFTADNGCSPQAKIPSLIKQGHKPNADWRGHKADIFEGGHRTPFLVRWPAKVKPGTVSTRPSAPPTCSPHKLDDIIGNRKKLPDNAAEDSFSFLPALLGQAGCPGSAVHHPPLHQRLVRHPAWQMETHPLPRLRRLERSPPK